MWTSFYDVHSGGCRKEPWDIIFIEAPLEEAKLIFINRFEHDPDKVTCQCCGRDYSIDSGTLEELTSYDRHDKKLSLAEYLKSDGIHILDKSYIKKKGLANG